MHNSTESIDSLDLPRLIEWLAQDIGNRDLEIDPTVRPGRVVVLDELGEHALEMAFVSDEQPVEALAPSSANESFSEGVGTRRADRRLDDPSTNASEDLIERPDELGVSIADQEFDYSALVLESHDEIARLLSDPRSDRMLGDPSQEDLASLGVDEEQHIPTTQRDRVDVEEVAGQRAGSLGAKELCPRRSRSSRRRFEPVSSKHIAHGGRREIDAEFLQLADDPEIAPARILSRARRRTSATTSASSALVAVLSGLGKVQ